MQLRLDEEDQPPGPPRPFPKGPPRSTIKKGHHQTGDRSKPKPDPKQVFTPPPATKQRIRSRAWPMNTRDLRLAARIRDELNRDSTARSRIVRSTVARDLANRLEDDPDPVALVCQAWLLRVLDGSPAALRKAQRLDKKAATLGDPTAIVGLGVSAKKRGNWPLAAKYFRAAARKQHPEGFLRLAELRVFPKRDKKRSLRGVEALLQEALRLGSGRAALLLGWKREHFDRGRADEAAPYYRAAARLGEADAMNDYAICLETGNGVPRDPAAARRWYEKAARAGVASAKRAVAVLNRQHGRSSTRS